jgi:hypothetical protein
MAEVIIEPKLYAWILPAYFKNFDWEIAMLKLILNHKVWRTILNYEEN